MTELELFKNALEHARYVPHPRLPIGVPELNATQLAFGQISPNGTLGYSLAGVRWVHRLASELHARNEKYRRGASQSAFRNAVAGAALKAFDKRDSLQPLDLEGLKTRLERWYTERESSERRLIPCALIPRDARPFDIGPVRFISAAHLSEEGIDTQSSGVEFLFRLANERRACWFASVSVCGESHRRAELAELAVDLALASLHLIFPEENPMLRLTGRSRHDWVGQWTVHGDGSVWMSNNWNLTPGLALSSEYFENAIQTKKLLLDSCGAKIGFFLALDKPLNSVAHAWCDAAHWYYEAVCDDLDSTAIAKLEACLENLTSAEKRHSSGSRIRGLLQRVLGLSASDLITGGAPLTVKEFADELVEARSRVLHGTSSTLAGSSRLTRAEATDVAAFLLAASSLLIDDYCSAAPTTELSVRGYQDWLKTRRDSEKSTAQGGA